MKKIMLFMVLGMFLISLASAEVQTLPPVKQGDIVDLPQTCSNCTYMNISVNYPNQSIAIRNKIMTKVGSEYNYSFSNTTALGNYISTTCGNPDGVYTCVSYDFEVNPSGEKFNIYQGFMILGQIAMVILFFGLGLSFAKEKWKLKTFFFMMAMGMGIVILNSTKIIAAQSGKLNTMGNVGITIGIVVFFFMISLLLVYFTIDVIDTLKRRRERKWV